MTLNVLEGHTLIASLEAIHAITLYSWAVNIHNILQDISHFYSHKEKAS